MLIDARIQMAGAAPAIGYSVMIPEEASTGTVKRREKVRHCRGLMWCVVWHGVVWWVVCDRLCSCLPSGGAA